MKRIAFAVAGAMILAACQTPGPQPTPGPAFDAARCQSVVDAANQAGDIVTLLGSLGIAPAKAEALARLIRLGSLGTAGLCAILFPPVKPLPAHPGELPPPPPGQ